MAQDSKRGIVIIGGGIGSQSALSVAIDRAKLQSSFVLVSDRICACNEPSLYNPKGICAPALPIGQCMTCGGTTNKATEV